ncbi:MAG: hypothetical protein AB9903_08785 [Vulcanimicrobiota bacterium]
MHRIPLRRRRSGFNELEKSDKFFTPPVTYEYSSLLEQGKEDFTFPPIEYYRIMKRIAYLKFVWIIFILSLITVTSAFAMDLDCMTHGCHHENGGSILCHRERNFCSQLTQTDLHDISTPCLSEYISLIYPDFSTFTGREVQNSTPWRDRNRVTSLRAPPERAL